MLINHFSDGNNSEFAKKIGINEANIRSYEKGTLPKIDVLEKIGNKFEVNFEWLLTGKGSMLSNSESQLNKISPNYLKIPVVPVYAQAGFLSGFGDQAYWDGLPTEMWEVDREYKGHYVVFEVRGDSMDDGTDKAILEGDKLLCREVRQEYWKSKLHIDKWNFVIVHREEGIIVKRIIEHNTENGDIICHSLNTYYKDKHLNLKDVVCLYNVVDRKGQLRI